VAGKLNHFISVDQALQRNRDCDEIDRAVAPPMLNCVISTTTQSTFREIGSSSLPHQWKGRVLQLLNQHAYIREQEPSRIAVDELEPLVAGNML
jgi:hypothetical protein